MKSVFRRRRCSRDVEMLRKLEGQRVDDCEIMKARKYREVFGER